MYTKSSKHAHSNVANWKENWIHEVLPGNSSPGKIPGTVNRAEGRGGESALDADPMAVNSALSGKLVDSRSHFWRTANHHAVADSFLLLFWKFKLAAMKPTGDRPVTPLNPPALYSEHRNNPLTPTPPSALAPSQVKLNRMSASLRNARNQISSLQGRMEGINLLNMDNVQAMVDRRVENITGVINKLSSTCTTECAVRNTPQCKPAFLKTSLS